MRSPRATTKSSPCSLQLEKSPHASTKTQHSQKKKDSPNAQCASPRDQVHLASNPRLTMSKKISLRITFRSPVENLLKMHTQKCICQEVGHICFHVNWPSVTKQFFRMAAPIHTPRPMFHLSISIFGGWGSVWESDETLGDFSPEKVNIIIIIIKTIFMY